MYVCVYLPLQFIRKHIFINIKFLKTRIFEFSQNIIIYNNCQIKNPSLTIILVKKK